MSRRRSGQLSDLHVLRYVPVASPIHRSWAGTKILSILVLTIGLLLWPSWAAAGLALAVALAAGLAARLPRGIAPRVPRVVWGFFLLGAVIALVAGGGKPVQVGRFTLHLGGLEQWALFSLIGLDLLGFAALMSWTTPLADLAPALGSLGRPLERLRVPVDEIVGAIALAIRCLPLLVDEVRILFAARRTRRPTPPRDWKERSQMMEEMLMAGLASALRRAGELAEAIEARGGVVRQTSETHRLGAVDVVVLGVVAAATAGMGLLR